MKFWDSCLTFCRVTVCGWAPIVPANLCGMCFEPGGVKRKCCNAVFCDHCYSKNKTCPNCKAATRQEKMTGATYAVTIFSEHEECRICLDPGIKRKCCGNYYCDECFYNQPRCRSCDQPVGKKGFDLGISRAKIVAIVIGWLVTLFIIGGLVGLYLVLMTSELRTPVLMSNYKCFGFYRTCDVPVCIDLNTDVANGTAPIPALNTWQYCDLNSVVKLQSLACVFDEQLYQITDRHLGFDVCMETYTNGVYIFEDTFDNWQNATSFNSNLMKSATWSKIVNGYSTDFCGTPPNGGLKALTFAGQFYRYAITGVLDVSSGGWIEAEIFIPPQGFDITNVFCKSNYDGGIFLDYSVDGGNTWVMLQYYDPWQLRSEKYFHSLVHLPPEASTNHTQFRYHQPAFEAARDAWALDNVKVYRYLPQDWHQVPSFWDNVQRAYKKVQFAQCCFDTDWCEARLSPKEQESCNALPWYKGPKYIMRTAEWCLLLVVLGNIVKFVYVSGQALLMRKRLPFQDEVEDLASVERCMKHIPPRWRPRKALATYVSDVHQSARLMAEMRKEFEDDPGQGERQKRDEELKRDKEKEKKRIRKEKKKLEKRMKLFHTENGVPEAAMEIQAQMRSLDEEEVEVEAKEEKKAVEEKDPTKFASDAFASDTDKFKRQNVAMLRIPFDNRVSLPWVSNFAIAMIGIYALIFLYKISTTTYYVVYQNLKPFGTLHQRLELSSFGSNLLAALCDAKELYFTLKFIVPSRPQWTPLITVDLSDTIHSLFIGPYVIPMADISDVSVFTKNFARLCVAGYAFGALPLCIISLILRDQYLPYPIMRIVTPAIGGVLFARAVLGAGFVVKLVFAFQYVFSFDFYVREKIGLACQAPKTRNAAINAAIALALLGSFLVSTISFPLALDALGILFGAGLVFGSVAGFSHGLPIRPWMCFTVLDGGVWFKVKKKLKCPCVYWGRYCTDMHTPCEVFVIYTTDDLKFSGIIKGNVGVGGQEI